MITVNEQQEGALRRYPNENNKINSYNSEPDKILKNKDIKIKQKIIVYIR